MNCTNPISEEMKNQTVVLANLLSAAYASTLVDETLDVTDAYQPVMIMRTAIGILAEQEAYPVAFALTLAWFHLVECKVPKVLRSIDMHTKLAAAFVDELLLDLDDILSVTLDDRNSSDAPAKEQ